MILDCACHLNTVVLPSAVNAPIFSSECSLRPALLWLYVTARPHLTDPLLIRCRDHISSIHLATTWVIVHDPPTHV